MRGVQRIRREQLAAKRHTNLVKASEISRAARPRSILSHRLLVH
jgi:hypothetical protein